MTRSLPPAPRALPALLLAAALAAGCAPGRDDPRADSAAPLPTGSDSASFDAPPPATGTVIRAAFRCEDTLVGATFDNAAEDVTLSWSGHQLRLPQAISASGARYADAQGNEFWNKGNTATFTRNGSPAVACEESDETSPWDDARDRGALLLAMGNEPGWMASIEDHPLRLEAQLDYGERSLRTSNLVADPSLPGWRGTDADGEVVVLRVDGAPCNDGMSEQEYPAGIELHVGQARYRGCGAHLR